MDQWRALLPVEEGWARSKYESSGWGSRWEWVEFFSNRGIWHSLIGGDGPGEGWWGTDEEDGRDEGSREEEEVGGSGWPGGQRARKKWRKGGRRGVLDKTNGNDWQRDKGLFQVWWLITLKGSVHPIYKQHTCSFVCRLVWASSVQV